MDNHTEFAMSVMESNYLPTAEFVLTDGVIELEYSEHAEAESPGTYVWIAERTECEPGFTDHVVIYIGEYGFTIKYRMHQHWASWPRTTRSNQKEPDHKKQKGDTILKYLQAGYTVKIYSKPAQVVHLQAPHPLKGFQTDVPDMLRMDTKSYEEASLLEAFHSFYGCRPELNGTKGSKGTIITEGFDYNPASKGPGDVKPAAPEITQGDE
tara:strand:+ start:295 stop:924 length:630 start_codon:yes stop_codon:yes gene_type:complete